MTPEKVKEYLAPALDELSDEQITPHLNRAIRDFSKVEIDEADREDAVVSKTIYYLAPIIWLRVVESINDIEGDFNIYKDIESFQAHWLKRANSSIIVNSGEVEEDIEDVLDIGGMGFGAV